MNIIELGNQAGFLVVKSDVGVYPMLERFAAAVIKAHEAKLIEGAGEPDIRQERWDYNSYGEITGRAPDFTAYSKEKVAGAVAKYKEALDCDSAILAARTKVMNQQAERIATLESTLKVAQDGLARIHTATACSYSKSMANHTLEEIQEMLK